ncbi:uncharacterized protein LOC124924548 [Impatiens glandulifera]|uniref:uncharacterized protein LOC124924548 n=1 Tax=Impatiens glandulifera TaxID=253017 RepID=UPI001FB11941|nr:uncharacterized protein LOC124924548 [Impatiens glandulifera]
MGYFNGFSNFAASSIRAASSFPDTIYASRFKEELLFVFRLHSLRLPRGFSEFGVDGGPAAKTLKPKFNIFLKHATDHTGLKVSDVEIKHLIAASIVMKGLGSFLFIFGSSIRAYLLLLHKLIATPILYDFYNYDDDRKEYGQLFVKFTQSLALFGAILFFIGINKISSSLYVLPIS